MNETDCNRSGEGHIIGFLSPIHRLFIEAFNQGNLAVVDEVFSPEHFVHHTSGSASNSPQSLKRLIVAYRTGFPDLHCTIETELNLLDRAAALWKMSGTHKGLFQGNSPTGKPIEVQGITFANFAGHKIVAYWMLIDQIGLLQQLGVIPH